MPRLMPSLVGAGVGVISGLLAAGDAANVATRGTLMKQQGSWFDFGVPLAVVALEMTGMYRNSEMTDAAYYAGLGLSGARVTRSSKTGHLGNAVPNMIGSFGSLGGAPMVAGYAAPSFARPAVLRQPTGTLR